MRRTVLSEDQRKEIAKQYGQGVHTDIISEQYHITDSSIRRIAGHYNIKRPYGNEKKLHKEQKDKLIIDYNNGFNRELLAKKYGLSNGGLYKAIHKLNEDKLTIEQKNIIIEKYKNGASISGLCTEYTLNYQYIYYLAKKYKVDKLRKHKYEINESFFKNIKTEMQAYWIGFIMADGYINDKYFSLGLSYKDVYHLVKFRKDIKSNHPMTIYFSNFEKPMINFKITRKQMSYDLTKLGFDNHKTGNEHFPTELPPELYRHFIRGYFDGDGTVQCTKNCIRLSFCCANLDFLKEIQHILVEKCNLNYTKIIPGKNCYDLYYNGTVQCTRIAQYLWGKSNFYLPRKINKMIDSGLLKEEIKLGTYLDY